MWPHYYSGITLWRYSYNRSNFAWSPYRLQPVTNVGVLVFCSRAWKHCNINSGVTMSWPPTGKDDFWSTQMLQLSDGSPVTSQPPKASIFRSRITIFRRETVEIGIKFSLHCRRSTSTVDLGTCFLLYRYERRKDQDRNDPWPKRLRTKRPDWMGQTEKSCSMKRVE